LGTTAILVAAALLMLAVVGAIVAFRGWPGGAAGAEVQPVPLAPPTASARVALVRPVTRAPAVVRTPTASAVPAATQRLSTAGLVKQVSSRSGVSGLVLVPASGSPMRGQVPSPGGPNGPAAPGGQLPDPGTGGPLAPGGGGFDPGVQVPSPLPATTTDQLSAAIGQLVGDAPPPPALTRLSAAVASIR
jgi:hypothetical protein